MNTFSRIACIGLLALPMTKVMAAPIGYSINSDEANGDSLYSIDLATGQSTQIALVQSLGITRMDIEGLAFDNFGVLWGIDDESQKLFPIDTNNATVMFQEEVDLSGLANSSRNDFGLTFTCDGEVYASTVGDQSLYRLTLDGQATKVGDLGANISALAAIGKPARLFGLSNGTLNGGGTDTRSLYEIDPVSGNASLIGPLGAAAGGYFEGGLSFDSDGNLWAITDRSSGENDIPSELLQINTDTGAATLRSTSTVTGFESLAVAGPSNCDPIIIPGPIGDDTPRIPTLDAVGKLATILALMLAGLFTIRRFD